MMMKEKYTPTQLSLAKEIFEYLYLFSEVLPHSDVIIGFGHFDLKIPRHCGELYMDGYARRIIFTGGIGSGTADLGQAEAVVFKEELRRRYPSVSTEAVIVEDRSTNTSENVQFTAEKLEMKYPDFTFGEQIKKAIIVANAYRQRRVFLTCRRNLPQVEFYNAPPATTFDEELRLFSSKGFDFVELLIGEIDRLIRYGEKEYILQENIPKKIYDSYVTLKLRN
jgi:uncharacterized SAM-binding protein YcdF (DUF218 family)